MIELVRTALNFLSLLLEPLKFLLDRLTKGIRKISFTQEIVFVPQGWESGMSVVFQTIGTVERR